MAGWLSNLRDMKNFGFAILRDRTGLAQVVLEAAHLEQLKGLQLETVIKVTGLVKEKKSKDPNAKEVEVQCVTISRFSRQWSTLSR